MFWQSVNDGEHKYSVLKGMPHIGHQLSWYVSRNERNIVNNWTD